MPFCPLLACKPQITEHLSHVHAHMMFYNQASRWVLHTIDTHTCTHPHCGLLATPSQWSYHGSDALFTYIRCLPTRESRNNLGVTLKHLHVSPHSYKAHLAFTQSVAPKRGNNTESCFIFLYFHHFLIICLFSPATTTLIDFRLTCVVVSVMRNLMGGSGCCGQGAKKVRSVMSRNNTCRLVLVHHVSVTS